MNPNDRFLLLFLLIFGFGVLAPLNLLGSLSICCLLFAVVVFYLHGGFNDWF